MSKQSNPHLLVTGSYGKLTWSFQVSWMKNTLYKISHFLVMVQKTMNINNCRNKIKIRVSFILSERLRFE